MNKNIDVYLDGNLSLYEDKDSRNSFGAKVNENNMVCVATKVPFAEMSKRQSDMDFASMNDFSLSMKVKIQYCYLLKRNKKYKCVIDSGLYDVSYFDSDKTRTYLYLEYVREVTS